MIKKWFEEGNTTCPKTEFYLDNQNLTPNKVIADLIKDWIVAVEQCGFSDGNRLEKNDRRILAILLSKLSSTLSDQRDAARKLRSLTERGTFVERFFGESEKYITRLINPLLKMSLEGEIDVDIQEDLIAIIFYIASDVSNTKILIETPNLIDVVTSGFKSLSDQTKRMALAAISSLSNLEPNAILICEWATLNRFVEMLIDEDIWNQLLGPEVVTTMSKLFLFEENRDKAARTGVVLLLYNELRNWGYMVQMEGLSSVLVMLSRGKRAVEALHDMEASTWLLQTIKKTRAEQLQENCVVILYNMHVYIQRVGGCSNLIELNKLRKIEKAHLILAWLATYGTEKAKNSANSLLDCIG